MDAERITQQVNGVDLAVRTVNGQAPGLFWLGGYRSDMAGTKALAMEQTAREHGLQSTRFDYSGHGESGGDFLDGTISVWLAEALAVIDKAAANGPQILIGSSMGAWIALRMAQELNSANGNNPIVAMLLLAPAPDFTVELMEPELTEAQKAALATQGYFEEPTPYGPEPNRYTRALFEDGRENRVMTGPLDTFCPVHIIQGKADPDVPWQHAQKLFELLSKDDASMTFVPDGDHRLSRDDDIALIVRSVLSLVDQARTG
ncbi:MAG: alpha/beta hydrolase [Pseudomonadota bacterium]